MLGKSLISVKGPALDCLDHEVPGLHQGRVVVGGAGLGPPLTQARVKPQPKLPLSRTRSEVANVRETASITNLIQQIRI